MLILFAINVRKNKYYIFNSRTSSIVDLKKKDILELCKENKVINIRKYGDEIKGLNYSISRFTDYCSNGRSYVINVFKSMGTIIAYEYIDSSGKLEINNTSQARLKFRKHGIVNGVVEDGEINLIAGSYCVVDKTPKSCGYTYDIDDYSALFKKYKLLGFSPDKRKVEKYASVFGVDATLERTDMESTLNSFINGHKMVTNILNQSEIVEVNPIYKNITYKLNEHGKNTLEATGIVGYTIKYSCQERIFEVNICSCDKKLLAFTNDIETKKLSLGAILNLWKYNRDSDEYSSLDGITTALEISSGFNVGEIKRLQKLYKTKTVKLELNNGNYVSEDGIKLPIRNNLRINCSEHIKLFNELRI